MCEHCCPSLSQKGLPKHVPRVSYKLITTDKCDQMLLAERACALGTGEQCSILTAPLELDFSLIADKISSI